MRKFYSINIQNDFVNILLINKKRNRYSIIEHDVIDIKDFSTFLKNKKSFYIAVNTEEVIDDTVTVPSTIKKDIILRSFIIKKFKNHVNTKKILLNYHKLFQDDEESTITYKVDAIAQHEYEEALNYIPDWLDIKSSTINKFALLSLTRECYKNVEGYGYFSVYTQKNSVTVLAIDDKGNLLFERNNKINVETMELRQLTMVEEINQTIAYVKQQFRSTKFSTILISGSMAVDDVIAEHLLLSSNLAIAVLYPNTFIDGLKYEEPHHYIMSLGAFLVKKKDQFLPKKIFNLREYNFMIISLFIISFLSITTTSYIAYQEYQKYTMQLDEYEKVRNRLLQMVRKTDTYSLKDLEKSYKHLQIAEKYLKHSPIDYFITLKPLLKLLQPQSYNFNDNKELDPDMKIVFQKKFTTLSKLYRFEKKFLRQFTLLNKDNKLKYNNKTDYKSMKFYVVINNKPKEAPIPHRKRRRRKR